MISTFEKGQKSAKESVLDFHDIGFARDYKVVWDYQKKLLRQRIDGDIGDSVIVVEHDHVLTLGRSSHLENVLIRDLPTFEIERGGDVTYHGPGQIVMYPIVSLQQRGIGVRQFVELIESSIIDTLLEMGMSNEIEGKLGTETGVWIENKRKIASIGVAVSHWVSYHGLALNVNTDLSYFQRIKPCGFESSVMTSLAKELHVEAVDIGIVKRKLVHAFSKKIGAEVRTIPKNL